MLKYFQVPMGKKETEAHFRSLCQRYHPDKKDGNSETMAQINGEYQQLQLFFDLLAVGWGGRPEPQQNFMDKIIQGAEQINKAYVNVAPLVTLGKVAFATMNEKRKEAQSQNNYKEPFFVEED